MSDNSTSVPTAGPTAFENFLDTGSFFLGTALDGMLYGFFAAAFLVFIAVHRYQGKKVHQGVPNIAIITLFTLCTTYIVIDLWDEYYALTLMFPERQLHLNTVEGCLYSLIDLICQFTLIYRCFVIYEHSFLVTVAPAILSLTAFAGEIATVALIASPNAATMIPKILNLGTAAFCLSLGCNAIITVLISTKIWRISKAVDASHPGQKSSKALVAMLFESGITIMVAQLLWVVLFRTDNSAGYNVVAGAITQIYGITPCVLAIRIALGASYDTETQLGSTTALKGGRQESSSPVDEKHSLRGSVTA